MTNAEFISCVAELAKNDCRVLPSLTIAQAILESGWGRSGLTKKANALFGIKAGKDWKGKVYSSKTKECYDGVNFVDEVAAFRAYNTWGESVQDHTEFLCGLKRYAAVIGEKDYKKACKAIKAAGYATDPDYAEKLIALIEKYKLYEFDGGMSAGADVATEGAESVTRARVHKVVKGDTLAAIAKRYGVSVGLIVQANKDEYKRITPDYIQAGWILDIPTQKYIVKRGDTLTAIAQRFNTTVEKIVENNRAAYSRITPDYIQAGWVLIV